MAAKAAAVKAGGTTAEEAVHGGVDIDPMAALDAATGMGKQPAFVPAKDRTTLAPPEEERELGNADEIEVEDESDED